MNGLSRNALVAATLVLGTACSPSTAPLQEPGACVTDLACPAGEECGPGGCQPLAPALYPHIQTASALFRPHLDGGEASWRAAHNDVLIAHVAGHVDAFRAVNPHVRLFEYINIRYHRYDDVPPTASEWALAHGFDPENFYLHYREDVDVPTWESMVLVDGYPPGRVPGWVPGAGSPSASAVERYQSRAVGFYGGGSTIFYMANVGHAPMRLFIAARMAALLDGSYYGVSFATGPMNGIIVDNAIHYPRFDEGLLAHTHEYWGLPNDDYHPYARAFETLYPEMAQALAARFGSPADLLINYGHVLFLNNNNLVARNIQKTTPWAWAQVWVTYRGYASPTLGPTRCITYDRDYENGVAAVVRQTRAGGRRVLGAHDLVGGGGGSDRGRLFTLALYYLLHNRHTYYLYETVNGHQGAGPLSAWQWNEAVTFDVGQPAPVPPGRVDFDGKAGTTEHYLLASGTDPYDADLTYRVLARRFTNALVIVKMLPEGSVVDDRSITTHPLDGSYAVLRSDGTLGAVVTEATIRNNEGLLLIPVD
jgi:hypothetical protein